MITLQANNIKIFIKETRVLCSRLNHEINNGTDSLSDFKIFDFIFLT